ncbi:MAG: hypothetical protein ACRC46_15355 [Thermoguttaceae bacterium]
MLTDTRRLLTKSTNPMLTRKNRRTTILTRCLHAKKLPMLLAITKHATTVFTIAMTPRTLLKTTRSMYTMIAYTQSTTATNASTVIALVNTSMTVNAIRHVANAVTVMSRVGLIVNKPAKVTPRLIWRKHWWRSLNAPRHERRAQGNTTQERDKR